MARASFAHKPRLKRYIESRGKILPPNFSVYVAPGDNDKLCVFCDEEHDSNEVMIFKHDAHPKGAVGTGCFMCNMCFDHVKAMETKLMGAEGKGHLFDSQGTEARINMFLNNIEFETDIVRHYRHNGEFFAKVPHEVEICYFCKNVTANNYFYLKTPMTGSTYLDGGQVRCCFSCRDIILETSVEQSFALIAHNHGAREDFCPGCKTKYLVSAGEIEYRLQSGTTAMHLCTRCSCEQMERLHSSATLDALYEFNTEDYKIERFAIERCEYCELDIELDLTIISDVMYSLHVSEGDKLMCRECARHSRGPIAAVNSGGKIWAVYPTREKDIYRIIVRTIFGTELEDEEVMGNIGHIILDWPNVLAKYADTSDQRQQKLKF